MKTIKGKLKIILNDAAGLTFRVQPIEFLQYAKNFKLIGVENDLVATYVWSKPGYDWKASIQNVFISDIMDALNKVYVSDKVEYEQLGKPMAYKDYLKLLLPNELNEELLKRLTQDYDVTLELHV